MSASAARSIVTVLAVINQQLLDLATSLRGKSAVKSAVSAINPRHYEAGDRVECYVDTELLSGNAVGWWLEFRWEEGSWIIESSVRHNTAEGEDELVGLATRYAVGDAELADELTRAVAALVATADRVDLEAL